jgi:hypothetical protein
MLLVVFATTHSLMSWERKLNRDGITVDTRSVEGSDFKEFRARMRVKSTLAKATEAAEPNALPQKSGRVRIQRLKGYWSYVEISPGELDVTYSMHSEPGGNLPSWAAASPRGWCRPPYAGQGPAAAPYRES